MSIASLLLKEVASASLSTLVETAIQRSPPFPEYELQLDVSQLVLIQKNAVDFPKVPQPDEGFESDIDSLSIVSSDESFTCANTTDTVAKAQETDSANGSASSDSDTDSPSKELKYNEQKFEPIRESHNLVNCLCYTDVKCDKILVFVIKDKTLVFKFDNVQNLRNFHAKFAALKAVNSQIVYNKNPLTKQFNLLQKTDNNGVTHIQINREPKNHVYVEDGPSSIISINTPEDNLNRLIKTTVQQVKSLNEYNKTNSINQRHAFSTFLGDTDKRKSLDKSASASNLLDLDNDNNLIPISTNNFGLRKVWNSTENLLNGPPKRPERKKKTKGKAPSPPNVEIKQDILSGQYVRVNVIKPETIEPSRAIMKGQIKEPHPKKLQNFTKPSLNLLVKNKAAQILKYTPKLEISTLTRHKTPPNETWTNSMPRIVKPPRSKSETRIAQPMAYRYIDTTINYPVTYVPVATANGRILKSHESPYAFGGQGYRTLEHSSTIGNRLFGLSPKLKDLNPQHQDEPDAKWKNCETLRQNDGNLKSVIKKDENRRKNEKKVTFSAYTTVQVV